MSTENLNEGFFDPISARTRKRTQNLISSARSRTETIVGEEDSKRARTRTTVNRSRTSATPAKTKFKKVKATPHQRSRTSQPPKKRGRKPKSQVFLESENTIPAQTENAISPEAENTSTSTELSPTSDASTLLYEATVTALSNQDSADIPLSQSGIYQVRFPFNLESSEIPSHSNEVKTRHSTETVGPEKFQPKILKDDETILHCLPSTDDLRRMCSLLNLEYDPENQLFWLGTYSIDEIHSGTIAGNSLETTVEQNIGFQAISLFLTNAEDSHLKIQVFCKRYFGETMKNKVDNDILLDALCPSELNNFHLWAFSKILECRIVIFSHRGVEVYGDDCFNNRIPSMILKQNELGYWPVVTVL